MQYLYLYGSSIATKTIIWNNINIWTLYGKWIIIFLFLNVSNHNNFISISRDSYWSWLLILIIYVKIHVCLAGSTIAYRNVPQCYCLFMVKEMVSFKFVWESMWACSFVCLFQEFLAFLRKINFGRRKHYFKVSWLK